MIKRFEIEHNPSFILIGLNVCKYNADDDSEGTLISIGLLFINLNFYI